MAKKMSNVSSIEEIRPPHFGSTYGYPYERQRSLDDAITQALRQSAIKWTRHSGLGCHEDSQRSKLGQLVPSSFEAECYPKKRQETVVASQQEPIKTSASYLMSQGIIEKKANECSRREIKWSMYRCIPCNCNSISLPDLKPHLTGFRHTKVRKKNSISKFCFNFIFIIFIF